MKRQEHADRIRRYVKEAYVRPARREGKKRFQVKAGEVHKALGLRGRVPAVCSALRSRELMEENGIEIVARSGPPSGQSTTVVVTYGFRDAAGAGPPTMKDPLLALQGIGRDVFRQLGGGETFILAERRGWKG